MEESSVPLSSWQEQLQNAITTKEQLEKYIELTPDEIAYFAQYEKYLKFRITPYYMEVILKDKSNALRKTMIPTIQEFDTKSDESIDFLEEDQNSKCTNLVHKYPDRALLLVTDYCGSICRYCTRSRLIDKGCSSDLSKEFEYIESHKELRDIIISGGDPLTLSTEVLETILKRLTAIKHLEVIRIGTKVPVVLPQRLDADLIKVLRKYSKKLWINIHFTHPKEITKECKRVCLKLSKLGIPLGSQTVLLKGVNDNGDIMKNLMQSLLTCKVVPRYLYNCDRTVGTSHFRSTVKKGLEIIRLIQGHTSGMASPKFVIDSPLGKLPLDLSRVTEITDTYIKFKNYNNEEYTFYEVDNA